MQLFIGKFFSCYTERVQQANSIAKYSIFYNWLPIKRIVRGKILYLLPCVQKINREKLVLLILYIKISLNAKCMQMLNIFIFGSIKRCTNLVGKTNHIYYSKLYWPVIRSLLLMSLVHGESTLLLFKWLPVLIKIIYFFIDCCGKIVECFRITWKRVVKFLVNLV